MKAKKINIEIVLICQHLPGLKFADHQPVYLGVQNKHEVVRLVPGNSEETVFTMPFRVQEMENGRPDIQGDFVNGTPENRFISLAWVVKQHPILPPFRRAKVSLKHLEMHHVEKASALDLPLIAIINMTNKKGEPISATIQAPHIRWLM